MDRECRHDQQNDADLVAVPNVDAGPERHGSGEQEQEAEGQQPVHGPQGVCRGDDDGGRGRGGDGAKANRIDGDRREERQRRGPN